jgi:hypothetical protein
MTLGNGPGEKSAYSWEYHGKPNNLVERAKIH